MLAPSTSRNARSRVPGSVRNDQKAADAKRQLSAALAGRRRGAGLTQPQLAEITGDPVTTIGHAETGRLWQSRPFWERADKALNANGELLRLRDTYRAVDVSTDPAIVATETALNTPDSAEAQSPAEGPPTQAIILIVWTDGAITVAP